jgi:ATP-dependent DNA helicase RecQ
VPQSMNELLAVSGIGPEKADRYGAEIVTLCRADGAPGSVVSKAPTPKPVSRPERPQVKPVSTARAAAPKAETFHRPARLPDEATGLTPEQQALDQRLRDWRKEASAQLGAPPFLVLGSGALRAIVLRRPRTADQLRSIDGITSEAARAHGPAILEICNG